MQALVDECHRQSENCGYTSTTFIIWLRWLRWWQTFCQVVPVVLGAVATWQIVEHADPVLAAVCAFLATVIPPAYRASKTDKAIENYEILAGEFTNLRDRFRQAANITSQLSFDEFQAQVNAYLDRLEEARRHALTPPEWIFLLARKKHKDGHYDHDYDQRGAPPSGQQK